MHTEVVLSLGGNKGDREMLLNSAAEMLQGYFELTQVSAIYETAAWGGVAKGNFLNLIAVVLTDESPEQVLEIIQGIEADLGRNREEPWGDRTMDIDIVYFGEQVIETDRLRIPHPFMTQRRFVLVPLAALLPGKMHPISGKSSVEMLEACKDESAVSLYRQ